MVEVECEGLSKGIVIKIGNYLIVGTGIKKEMEIGKVLYSCSC